MPWSCCRCRTEQAGERASVIMSLIESANLNGHDPWAYLKEVFERLLDFFYVLSATSAQMLCVGVSPSRLNFQRSNRILSASR